ncbi:hypothetical protein HLH36_18425 [Gluconacetobacter aggeris]|uniref:Uncharacterized protein n=1 Tax=Gluconacetobacter aggeris TaxID=1286186 RepID=A0A7W4NY86_9PROT|nr:hypothetical protein [Gluconacetobacter aggeris]MBB2170294.1 hypothetical protein [Gluconacetobacter aggeris]
MQPHIIPKNTETERWKGIFQPCALRLPQAFAEAHLADGAHCPTGRALYIELSFCNQSFFG